MHLCTVLDIQYPPGRIFIKQKTKKFIYIFKYKSISEVVVRWKKKFQWGYCSSWLPKFHFLPCDKCRRETKHPLGTVPPHLGHVMQLSCCQRVVFGKESIKNVSLEDWRQMFMIISKGRELFKESCLNWWRTDLFLKSLLHNLLFLTCLYI